MDDWHDSSRKKPDILAGEGFVSCLNGGSFGTAAETTTLKTGDNSTAISRSIYEPLKEKTDIRLLRVEPGDFEDPIQCSMFPSSTTSKTEYEAISYTWGGEDNNMEKTGRIRLGEKTFYVTPNCESALRHTRSKFTRKTIWIDAICINQDDVNERGHQVRVMPQIYSSAQEVLVYAGEKSPLDDSFLDNMAKFFRRRYFSRVWILQEIALASRISLIHYQNMWPWSYIYELSDSLGVRGSGRSLKLPPVFSIRSTRVSEFSNGVLDLLDLARECDATDPRDKIFAVYGLIPEAGHEELVPDYTKSTEDVFINVAAWIARNYGLAALIERTLIVDPSDENTEADTHLWDNSSLPAWVPDWTKRLAPNSFLKDQLLQGYHPFRPKLNPARASHFTSIYRENFTFPGFKLGSIADEFVKIKTQANLMLPGSPSLDMPWLCLELNLNRSKHPQRKVVKQHTLSTISDVEHRYYERSRIYLIPEPADYGDFLFEAPGLVTVMDQGDRLIWTHVDSNGVPTIGRFERHAICCWEADEDETKTLCGLLLMNFMPRAMLWRTGEFETVVAEQTYQSSQVRWGRD